jgi:hypothetical protein
MKSKRVRVWTNKDYPKFPDVPNTKQSYEAIEYDTEFKYYYWVGHDNGLALLNEKAYSLMTPCDFSFPCSFDFIEEKFAEQGRTFKPAEGAKEAYRYSY